MPSLAFYFLACLMSVTTIASHRMPIPATVNHADRQCILRGYLGFCTNLGTHDGFVDCKNVECAISLRGNARTHRAMNIGQAARGTHCGERKICYDGECIDLPRGINMPRQLLENEEAYMCHRPNSGLKPLLSSGYSG